MKNQRIPAMLLVTVLIVAGPALGAQITIGPMLENPGTDTMTVMWETDVPIDCSVIIAEPSGKEERVSESKKDVHHLVTLTDLRPGTTYSYRVMAETTALYEASFTTLGTDESYVVAFIGDTRDKPEVAGGLLGLIRRQHPCLIVNTGDMVTDGSYVTEWKKYLFDPGKDTYDHIPLVPILGNHDFVDGAGIDLYRRYFPPPATSPEGRLYYTFRVGDDLFVLLDDYTVKPYFIFTEGIWLWRTLNEASRDPRVRHLFVLSHMGIVSYAENRTGYLSLKIFTGLMARCGVTAVITGHDHYYARGQTYSGVHFFITAGGGAPLHDINRHNIAAILTGRMAFGLKTHNILIMNVKDDVVTFTAIDDLGHIIDTAQIKKKR